VIVFERNYGDMRAEDFLPDRAKAGPMFHAVDEWRQVTSFAEIALCHPPTVKQHIASLFASQVVVAFDLLHRRPMNDGSCKMTAVERITNVQPPCLREEPLNELIIDRLGHEDAAGGNTALATRFERADNGGGGRQIEPRVGADYHRALAAGLRG